MKLQGVLILRISDFRRFFDLDEFLVKKQEFSELMRLQGSGPFCDTAKERFLCGIVRNWINRDPFLAEIKNDKFVVNCGNEKAAYPLGVLKTQVDKYKSQLGFKDLYGIVALCLLAGANRKDCAFTSDFGSLVNERTGNDCGSAFVLLHKDTELPMADATAKGNFRIRVFANVNASSPVTVKTTKAEVTLQEGQCVTAVFSDSGCVALLPREAAALPTIHASLVPDKGNKRANLVISHEGQVKTIHGVASVWVEPGAGVAYVTDAGEVVYDAPKCYKLRSRLTIFDKCRGDRKLIAINKTDSGNYVLYTNSQIDY